MRLVIKNEISEIKTPQKLLKYMDENLFYRFVSKDNKIYIEQDEKWNKKWYDSCIVQDYIHAYNDIKNIKEIIDYFNKNFNKKYEF